MGLHEFVLLSLGAYRLWRIAARDTITAKAREAVTGYTDDQAPALKEADDVPPPRRWRVYLSALIRCPWCLGFYISVASYAAWRLWPELTLTIATPLAISAVLGLLKKNLDKEEPT